MTFYSIAIQAQPWQPSSENKQLMLWPGVVPDGDAIIKPEETKVSDTLVADKPWIQVSNVSQPTMTVYSPKSGNTGVAVVVFPGGGYQILAIDLEGTEVCDWLTSRGITCVLLKYRVPARGHHAAPHWGAIHNHLLPSKIHKER